MTVSLVGQDFVLDSFRRKFVTARQGLAYLDHASMSPLADPVRQAMIDAIEAMASKGSGVYTDILTPLAEKLQQRIGQLVNCCADEVAFVDCTSTGLNLVAQSLPWRQGDNVLVCDVEFPSNVYAWQNLSHRGVETRLVPALNGGLSLDSLDKVRDGRSRVIAVSAVQFFSGRREDLLAIGQYCKDHDLWLVVDAIQAAGIVPLDMRAMNISAIVSGGQKALLASPGQGFMAIRSDLVERMQPVLVGPLSVVDHELWLNYDITLKPGVRRFDMGTSNIAGMAGLLAAVDLLLEVGVDRILQWVTHLSDIAIADLQSRGYRVVTPTDPAHHAHIVTFALNQRPEVVVDHLRSRGVILRSHQDRAGAAYLRISSHGYNTEDDILRVGRALEELTHE